jgi:uncharacterized membrane protein
MKLTTADHLALGMIAGTSLFTGALYSRLPDSVPTHFNIHGVADGWMNREIGAWLLPATCLGVWLLLRFGALILPRGWKERMMASPTAAVGAIIAALLCALQGVVLYAAIAKPPTVAITLGALFGAFWIVLGLVMPRVRRNPWMGVRTAWTLSSDENWARTHRIAGYAFVAAGVLAVVAVAAGFAWAAPALIIVSAVVPMVYSFFLARHLPPSS